MQRILCFGELLLRLSPVLGGAWLQRNELPVFIGGAELNVATALARWEQPVSYCTALPDNYLTTEILEAVGAKGIDTAKVLRRGHRIGSYYLPQGADLKNAGVIYDRAYSSFWELKPGEINWDEVLEGVSWFHFTAISPALNETVAQVCAEGAKAAADRGITVSVDLNYRARLWQYGKHPADIMPSLVQYCDVVMGNIWAAEKMLGIPVAEGLVDEKEACLSQAGKTSRAIMERFPRCKQVANTFRFDAGSGVRYYATFYKDGQLYVAPEQYTDHVVDKIGSGDTFMAGLIYGNQKGKDAQAIIDFAAAAAFNKLFIKGDATTATVADIEKAYAY
ncbi:2-dehydro-3-deoxygluconokinase [Cnuella takakiae]|uniref:2-dehydro-3-deoxygluconokinase n=1 Tax=Cnuella takakiae TaxID=1302690 RepID=A0A1M5A2Q9_9BACT|nr:sugar kinase [Cnuella takakiae]OLY92122.1 carbohydrate kinase [Cnuella takakiae]SHF24387.1 2-dehydro-3-deoxygluconokinase [Cnuella takakiae]